MPFFLSLSCRLTIIIDNMDYVGNIWENLEFDCPETLSRDPGHHQGWERRFSDHFGTILVSMIDTRGVERFCSLQVLVELISVRWAARSLDSGMLINHMDFQSIVVFCDPFCSKTIRNHPFHTLGSIDCVQATLQCVGNL